MDTTNPFVWILGFVLVFWIIGGGVGFGNRHGYANEVAPANVSNNGVGTRDILDTIFATATQTANGLSNLKDQNTDQTFLLAGQINTGNQNILDRIDRSEREALARENANLRQALQTNELKAYLGTQFSGVQAELCRKANIPPFLVDGSFAQGDRCGC